MENKKIRYFISIATVTTILFVWFFIANFTAIPNIILPTPQAVWESLIRNSVEGYGTSGTLVTHLFSSMKRLGIAYLLALITAVPLGLLSGYFMPLHAAVGPIVEFYRMLPPLAYYTVLVLWLGIGEESKITLLYLAAFAPIYIGSMSGVDKIREDYLNAAYMLGANKLQGFIYVILPAALPEIFVGLRTGLGVEYSTLVSAEMIAARTGIGWMILDASNWLKSDTVFMGILIIGITGIALNALLVKMEHKLIHWNGK